MATYINKPECEFKQELRKLIDDDRIEMAKDWVDEIDITPEGSKRYVWKAGQRYIKLWIKAEETNEERS